jgi:hypothetical protein
MEGTTGKHEPRVTMLRLVRSSRGLSQTELARRAHVSRRQLNLIENSHIPVRASDVEVRPVEWLWAPFVPLRKITALAGNMGQGKSLLTTWLAAMTTTGGLGRPGSVLMLSAEDDAEDTIVPRLAAAGAELTRVHLVPAMQLDADDLAARCKELGNVKLVTVVEGPARAPRIGAIASDGR